jgi:hypothetical protein
MVEVRGNATAHTADGHLGLPMAVDRGVRPAHRPQPSKPTGLDWSAISPPCSLCGKGSSELRDGLCPLCRGVMPTPKDVKDKGGRTVTSADGETYITMRHDDVERRYQQPEPAPAPEPPEPPDLSDTYSDAEIADLAEAVTSSNEVSHVAEVLTRAAGSKDPVARLLRLNVLSAAESLYLYLEHDRFGARPTVDVPLPVDLEAEPDVVAVAPEAEGSAGFETFEKPPRKRAAYRITDEVRAEIVRRYVAGENGPTLAAAFDCSTGTVYNCLKAAGVVGRPHGRGGDA